MEITVGLGSLDEYPEYAAAGAGEIFAGFVPGSWYDTWGRTYALNRREVRYVNVQLGSVSELEILADMVRELGVPVTITLNSPFYLPEQYPEIRRVMDTCRSLGFHRFIVGDPGLLVYLREQGTVEAGEDTLKLQISGELGEMNHHVLRTCRELGASRVIFHRKMSLADMRTCIEEDRRAFPERPIEYEAFLLNEMCHFHGGFCCSLHCDELCHMCRTPYRIGPVRKSAGEDLEKNGREETSHDYEGLGESGCGLCALWELREMGITHLKLVSRGNYVESTLEDLKAVKRAMEILKTSDDREEYRIRMMRELFPRGCSGMCYYREAGMDKNQTEIIV